MARHLKDLREFIEALAEIGEMQPIDRMVDWHLEMGAVIRHSYDTKAPAPLFNRIKDIEPGFRALGATFGTSANHGQFLARCAVALGLAPGTPTQDLVSALADLFNSGKRIPPRTLATGPCKENRLIGDAIDLERFPVPYIHDGDGGRYFNTLGTVVAQTPDGQWTNWAIARAMLVSKTQVVPSIGPSKDTTKIFAQWQAMGQDMPIAIFQGGPPVIPFASGGSLGEGVNEADVLGGFLGEPIEVVKCETHGLTVPATSEIVVEGFLSLTETEMEGPMGEYSGNLCPTAHGLKPVMNISAITYRDRPILPVVTAGFPVEENSTVWGLGISGRIFGQLQRAKFPVGACFLLFEAACHLLVVTVPLDYIRQQKAQGRYSTDDLIARLRAVVFDQEPGRWIPRIVLLADDIDPADINVVLWAIATRCRPDQQLLYPDETCGQPLISFLNDEERHTGRVTKTIWNCLRPDDLESAEVPIPSRFETAWPLETRERVLKNWKSYGYGARGT
ncbi:MAG: UbiD family decarboxylase [Pseudomonadota bacterium]